MRFALLLALVCSCAAAQKDAKVAESAFVDCAKTDVLRAVSDGGVALIEKVASVLAGGDYKAELDKLKPKLGADAVDCAVKGAVAAIAAQAHGLEAPPAVQHGNAYIAAVRFQ